MTRIISIYVCIKIIIIKIIYYKKNITYNLSVCFIVLNYKNKKI